MNKKVFIILGIIVILLVACIVFFINNKSTDGDFTDEELNDMETVDLAIDSLSMSDKYTKVSLEERKMMMSELLTKLKKQGLIKSIYYDKESTMYSFKYKSGALGGVMLKSWNSLIN